MSGIIHGLILATVKNVLAIRLHKAAPEVVLAFPPLVLLGLVGLLLLGNVVGVHPLWQVRELNLAEAVAVSDWGQVARWIAKGTVGVDERMRVPAGLLRSDVVELTPLEAAVARQNVRMFAALLATGVDVEAPRALELGCFAVAEGADQILALLAPLRADPDSAPGCEGVRPPW